MSLAKSLGLMLVAFLCIGACRDSNMETPDNKSAKVPNVGVDPTKAAETAPNTSKAAEVFSKADSCTKQLAQLAKVLRTGSAQDGVSMFGTPIVAVEQEYELRDAGEPYAPLAPRIRTLKSKSTVEAFIKQLKDRVGNVVLEVPNPPAPIEPSIRSTLAAHFNVIGMELCQITLEVGDLEHVLVTVLDPSSNLIRAVYLN